MAAWKELRDRRIIQILGGYLAAGWLGLEACDQLVDRGLLPELAYRLVLVFYLAGIPASLIVGWYHGEQGHQRAPRSELVLLSLIAVLALGGSAAVVQHHMSEAAATPAAIAGSSMDLNRIGVLYFEDLTSDGELGYLADGLTEELIDRLARIRPLDVISANGVRPFRGAGLARDSIARALRAGILVEGSVEETGPGVLGGGEPRLRVTTRLIDGESGALLERASVDVPLGELLTLRDQLAEEIATRLRAWLGDEVRLRERKSSTNSVAAWTLLQRARQAGRGAVRLATTAGADSAAALFERADSLLARAEEADPSWIDPITERAWLAYRRSRIVHDPERAGQAIETGLGHAARALGVDANAAGAHEARGTLRYWKYLLHLAPDPVEHAGLLRGAREDLERAVELDPSRASAHAALSHLYYHDDIASVVLAARRAYEEDAYLEDANQVLWRLFLGNYDLAQFAVAERWCDEGRRRFPGDLNFGLCRLYLLTAPTTTPDVDAAWRELARVDSLVPAARPDARRNMAQMLLGAVIGRAGLADSADHVLTRARLGYDQDLDPNLELYAVEAFARTRFGDLGTAIELLKRYVAVNHGFRQDRGRHWWWDELREDSRFSQLETAEH